LTATIIIQTYNKPTRTYILNWNKENKERQKVIKSGAMAL